MLRSTAASEMSTADEPIVRLRHPGRWVAAAVIVFLLVVFVHYVATAPKLRLDLVTDYLFERSILLGLLKTLQLTVVAMLFCVFLGTVVPQLSIGLPFGGPDLWSWPTNAVITQFTAAILGLGLNEAAYMAEIVRAGIGSVDAGQREAAEALRMSPWITYRRVILPQAARLIVPPTANQTISMLKLTSLVLVIGLPELTTTAQLIYGRNFQQIPLLIVASIWYLVLTTLLTVLQNRLENRMSRGVLATTRRRTKAKAPSAEAEAGAR